MLRRTFDAPPEAVFRLWTDPALVSQWWGVKGSTIDACNLDVRVGGRWHIEMRTAGGRVYPNSGTYLEVVPNERIVYFDEPNPAILEWNGDVPSPSRHTISFDGNGDRTMVTIEILFASKADRDRVLRLGMKNGLEQGLDRLQTLIAHLARIDP
jgi:uncharacterized protein YndB with AHSA1/START domain